MKGYVLLHAVALASEKQVQSLVRIKVLSYYR